MKLLIVTQKINKNDPILGFFHGWIREFSKHFESIVGICLEKGEYDLPANVKVLSLGKEIENDQFSMINDQSLVSNSQFTIHNSQFIKRLRYTLRFWSYIWRERKNYDAVFVHMNQEYILLGGLFWRLLNKKVYMWRNHHAGSFLTDLAASFCTKVFCTSKYSYTAKYKKTVLMPVGIDTDLFQRNLDIKRIPRSILFLGRIAPVKRPDLLIDALIELKNQNTDFTASIYGDPLPSDKVYYDSLVKKVKDNGLLDQVRFYAGIPNEKTVDIYNGHEIFVNLSSSGMYDKTIFEAMACECLVLASNKNLGGYAHALFTFDEGDKHSLVNKLSAVLSLDNDKVIEFGKEMRDFFAVRQHSFSKLSLCLKEEITKI